MKKFFILIIAGVLLTSLASAATSDDLSDTGLYVSCNIYGASVYIDGTYRGTTPLKVTGLEPGKHRLEVARVHYSTDISYVNVEEGWIREAKCELEKISGLLSVASHPEGATIYCDGDLTGATNIELDEGNHIITAKKFGYESAEEKVYIKRNGNYTVEINLDPTEFDIVSFDSEKTIFNPKNFSSLGNIEFNISVTAPETGVLEITNRYDEVVYTRDVEFVTWNQKEKWIGTDAEDYIVEDGVYTATLKAGGKSISYSFMVDSNIIYPMLTPTPSGMGVGSVASAQLNPKSTFIIALESGTLFTSEGSSPFYGVPINFSLTWTPTKYIELQGSFYSAIQSGFKFGFNLSAKAASYQEFGTQKFFYGAFVRVGGSSDPMFEPYGVDAGFGLGGGLLVGYLVKDFYLGLESSFLYRPVVGPFAGEGSDAIWKNGLMLQKNFDAASLGLYGNLITGYGEFKKGSASPTNIEAGIRSADFGAKFSFYMFNSTAALGVQGGTMIYPNNGFASIFSDSSKFYPYVKAALSWTL